jgi:arylsulfatase A
MGHPLLETPNIDRLAREGKRFNQMLAGGPVCAPTRCTLMTGKHLGHASVRQNSGENAIVAGEETIASLLKKTGYATGGFGKWGIGGRGTTGVPEKHGFDEFFGHYDQVHAHTFFPSYLIHNSKEIPLEGNTGALYEGKTFSHNVIFEKAFQFIKENKDKPFFCYCPWTPPHGLWGLAENGPSWIKFKDKKWDSQGQYRDDDAQRYAAMVHMVDNQIGQLIAYLKKTNFEKNTVVIVCGDNGGNTYFANEKYPHGFFGPDVNPKNGQVFRGKKGLLYEGGLRIPFIAKWTGKIKPGTVSDFLGYFPDMMPTCAEIAKVDCPQDVDGISFLSTLLGKDSKQIQHDYLYWEFNGQIAVRQKNWKAIKPGNGDWELYDLGKDIEEKNNVAAEYVNVLDNLKKLAGEAHTPHIKGEILNKELCAKDYNTTKNPLPHERRLN